MSSQENSRSRVACIGGSVTFGLGLSNRRHDCYPAVLGRLLGEGFAVRNFGYNGATAGRQTNEPYWQTPSMLAATRFEPAAVVIALGTNDAQHANRANLAAFQADLIALAEHFRKLSSRPQVVLTLPPPVFEPLPEIDIPTLDNHIRPAIEEAAAMLAMPLVDAFALFTGQRELFPDNLHPNERGAKILAEAVFEALEKAIKR